MMGQERAQVNTFSGHSQRADTSYRYYCHQMPKWLGFSLATAPAEAAPIVPQLVDKQTPKLKETQSEKEQGDSDNEDNDEEESEIPSSPPHPAPPPSPTSVPVQKDTRRTKSHSPKSTNKSKYAGGLPTRTYRRPKKLDM
jgi:hypothetical protein